MFKTYLCLSEGEILIEKKYFLFLLKFLPSRFRIS